MSEVTNCIYEINILECLKLQLNGILNSLPEGTSLVIQWLRICAPDAVG